CARDSGSGFAYGSSRFDVW
nr:immunoglobulin heavy chain junction region [Macaca mulatta]MOW22441.1 immunoglobulin heavy chain junction region [Macaca mulatta]